MTTPTAKQLRDKAWSALEGKRGTFTLIALLYILISGVCSYIPFASILVSGPMVLGLCIVSLKVIRGYNIEIGDMFGGFKNFGPALALELLNSILVTLWTFLFIVPGIIKAYAYSMSTYILADNPNMSVTDARKASIAMMRGNKWRLFCLEFSFIGWMLLSVLTCGILLIWVAPHMQCAHAEFYEDLVRGSKASEVDE